MQVVVPQSAEQPQVKERLFELWERTGDECLHRLAQGKAPRDGVSFETPQERSDWLSTCLMEAYKNTGDAGVFALLFELNEPVFLVAIHGHLRRSYRQVDANDVLQDVFLNIYKYPHRFLSDRGDAFRNWGHRIVRNTVLKSLRGAGKQARLQSLDEELQYADVRVKAPDRVASEGEGAKVVDLSFLLYLSFYLMHFKKLSPRERRALALVEVDGASYKEAAEDLGIKLENLKMVIFRGRRKIFRGMGRSLQELDRLADSV